MGAVLSLLGDYTFQTVAAGSAILGLAGGVIGSFAVLRKQSLLGDGISHATLPGVAIAFLLTGSKHSEVLLSGALVSGILAALLIIAIAKTTRVKFDGALALVMSVFFGAGLVLMTYIQKQPNANQAGLNRFIYGQASTLLSSDIMLMLGVGGVLLMLVAILWKELKLFTFDQAFADIAGFPSRRLNILLSLMIVAVIVLGIQTVGVVLMSAMLIAPAVAARQWTNRLSVMVLLAAVFGALSGVLGTFASSLISHMPTGPMIVVCMSAIACISLALAPGRGIVARMLQLRRHRMECINKGADTNVTTD